MKWSCRLGALLFLFPVGAALAGGSFDGRYSGPRTLLRGGPPICPAEGNAIWTVTDSKMTLPFFSTSVSVDVGPNGSFETNFRYQAGGRGIPGQGTIKGQIAGSTLTADYITQACQMHYVLKKQ